MTFHASVTSLAVDEAQRVILGRGVNGAVDDAVKWPVRAVAYRVSRVYATAVTEGVLQPIDLAVFSEVSREILAEVVRERNALFERDGR